MKPCTKDHNGRHEVCGMVEIYDANGRPHACAAGLRSQYQQELRDRGMTHWDASTQSSRDYRVWEFGIDHPYWNDRWSLPVVTNPCEIDYRKWVDHVVKALGFTMKQHEVFPTVITTPLKYNQLVFVMTLLRHPVEVRDHNLECYRWMVEHKTDPLGTLIGMCLDKPIEEDDDPWIPPSPFYGPVGHGFGDVAIYLSKRLKNILWRWRRFDMHKALEDLKKTEKTFGVAWNFKTKYGYLDVSREYIVMDGEQPARPKRKGNKNYQWQPRHKGKFIPVKKKLIPIDHGKHPWILYV